MRPQHPETCYLRREKVELNAQIAEYFASTMVASQKGWRILALHRISRVVRYGLRKEAPMNVYKN